VGGDPTALCPLVNWMSGDTPTAVQGNGSAFAHNAYGELKTSANAYVQCNIPCANTWGTNSLSNSQFVDSFTFLGLTGAGPYYLIQDIKTIGLIGGGFVTPSSLEFVSQGSITSGTDSGECANLFQTQGPSSGNIRLSCSARLQISSSDTIQVVGQASISAGAALFTPQTTPINQLIQADFSSKGGGNFFAYKVVDEEGRKVKGAVIVSRSGTRYPEHN